MTDCAKLGLGVIQIDVHPLSGTARRIPGDVAAAVVLIAIELSAIDWSRLEPVDLSEQLVGYLLEIGVSIIG